MPASAKQLLLAGVTSARDLGGPLEASIAVRNRINTGKLPGATVYVSGPFIQHEPYPGTEHFRWGVTGSRRRARQGAQARRRRRRLHQAHRPGPDDDGRGSRRRRRSPCAACRSSPTRTGRKRFVVGWRPASTASSTPASRARRSIPRTSSRDSRADGEDGARPALLDADDRWPAQLRVPARQSRSRSTIRRGTKGSRRTSSTTLPVHRAPRSSALLPAHVGPTADAGAEIQAAS